jgi:hypothetical protein
MLNNLLLWVPKITQFQSFDLLLQVKREEFIINRMSYKILTSHWYNITVLNVYALTKDNNDNAKDSFLEEWAVCIQQNSVIRLQFKSRERTN